MKRAVLMLCLITTPAMAAEPWHALLGYWGGMTREQAKAKGVENCNTRKMAGFPDSSVICDLPVTGQNIAGLPVQTANIVFPPPHNQAAQVQFVLKTPNFIDITVFDTLENQLGPSKNRDRETSRIEWHRGAAEAVGAQSIRYSVYVGSSYNPAKAKTRAAAIAQKKNDTARNADALKKF